MRNESVELSIVTTVYQSALYLDEFISRCTHVVSSIGVTKYEIIFIVDGSPDDSLERLLKFVAHNPHIRVIELSRNFGHHNATKAGLMESQGELVFLIDCDLETQPDILETFYDEMRRTNADVVYGFQSSRKGDWWERVTGGWFWRLINAISEIDIPRNIVTERLMKRFYVDELVALGDKNLFYGGLFYWVGFRQIGVAIKKTKRKSKSNYGLFRKVSLMLNAVTSFSTAPLKIIFNLGLIVSMSSFFYGFALVVRKLLYPESLLLGWTSVITLIIFMFGFIICILGFVGIYIAKTYTQVQERPTYIIRKKHGKHD